MMMTTHFVNINGPISVFVFENHRSFAAYLLTSLQVKYFDKKLCCRRGTAGVWRRYMRFIADLELLITLFFKITTTSNSFCLSYASYLAKSALLSRTVHFKQGHTILR